MSMTLRLQAAMNAHDADAFADLVATDYASEQPAHPARAFVGREQVRRNWQAVFEGVPDFRANLLSHALAGDVEYGEWDWRGSHRDGSPFAMRGATVFGIAGALIVWGRLYMEPVEITPHAMGIDDMVRETYLRTQE